MNNSFIDNMKRLREQRNITGAQLGIILGVGKGSISNYENGKRKITIDTAIDLDRYFEDSLDTLAGVENENLIDVSELDDDTKNAIKLLIERLKKNG